MHVPITTYSIITIRWSTKGTWSGPYFRTNVINILINKLFSISEENITQFSEIVFKRSANKSYRKNVLLVVRSGLFNKHAIRSLMHVWKIKNQRLTCKSTQRSWISLDYFFNCFNFVFKVCNQFWWIKFITFGKCVLKWLIWNEHRETQRSSIINLCFIRDI